jgi:hypothetical protein
MLNFPESMIALRTGAPITPEAWDSRHGQLESQEGTGTLTPTTATFLMTTIIELSVA